MKATEKNHDLETGTTSSPARPCLSGRQAAGGELQTPNSELQTPNLTHPLKQWLDHWNITTEALSRETKRVAPPGLHRSFIRHIYRDGGVASKKSVLKLSKTTGIPPEILMFPERLPDFNPEEYKPACPLGRDFIEQSVNS